MKKLSIFVAFMIATMQMMAEHVTPKTARKVASTFLCNNGKKAAELTDLTNVAGFPNLYIFSSDESFVIISADNSVKPILGYSLTDKFITEGMPENIHSWLQSYSNQIQKVIDLQLKTTPETLQQWHDFENNIVNAGKSREEVGPLITTNWDQTYPYNYYCPTCSSGGNGGHVYAGCVATAMAQVIKYYDFPVHGTSSHYYTHVTYGLQSANYEETYYDWTNMPAQLYSSSNAIQKQAVATLIYHCGVAVDMNYGKSGSGSSSIMIAPALINYFNFSQTATYVKRSDYSENNEWIALMRAELNASRPIIYNGFNNDTNPTSGHSFVCDGYGKTGYEDLFFHFNWGWSGLDNGYFSIDNLTPDGNGAGSSHQYSYLQDAIIGIQPSNNNAVPTELTYVLDEPRNVTLNWTGASGAVNYNIYRNNNYVGNSATTSYTETAPFGTNVYYIRSVDSENDLSLASNYVNITIAYQTPVIDDLEAEVSNNTVNLVWSVPEWCFPETESGILTYGNGRPGRFLGYNGTENMYWGHRYLPTDLAETSGKVIYMVSFYVREPGAYELKIYQGSTTINYDDAAYDVPTTLTANKSIMTTQSGWFKIDLENPVAIDSNQDLWVMIYDPEQKQMPAEYCLFNEHDRGGYFSTSIDSWTYTEGGYSFLIRTYLTDSTYTYNLYQDGIQIAHDLNQTTYNANLNNNAANLFSVRTNYYNGETNDSNMIGLVVGTASLSSLNMGSNDKMTLTAGSKLTVTGTLSNSVADNLVIENGGQLIHDSEGVKATVKKNIVPYTSDENGWNFIASPVLDSIVPSSSNGLLSGNYDLYYYDEPHEYWMNYRDTTFTIIPEKGYLYASTSNNILFVGTLTPSNSSVTISNLSHSAPSLNGFNLVGNPFACNATVDREYYIISNNTIIRAESGREIAPCEAIFVKANNGSPSITFTKAAASKKSE